jgi:transposase, IS30 family
VLVLYERKSRVTLAARLARKTAAEAISVMLAVFARIEPALRKSITFDNDTAFAQHALLRTMRAMTTWFCRKRQRPTTTLVAPSDRHRQTVRRGNPGHRPSNLTPRKCLGFKTPFQAILKELGKDVAKACKSG